MTPHQRRAYRAMIKKQQGKIDALEAALNARSSQLAEAEEKVERYFGDFTHANRRVAELEGAVGPQVNDELLRLRDKLDTEKYKHLFATELLDELRTILLGGDYAGDIHAVARTVVKERDEARKALTIMRARAEALAPQNFGPEES
jgi:hypothetical protein